MWKHTGVLFFYMSMRHYIAEAEHRRGSTLGGVITALSMATALSVTAVVVTPRYLTAQSIASDVVAARHPNNQQFITGLAALIGRSVEVLAVQPRGNTPYLELVLWLDDRGRPGHLDRSELAVLSHSEVLQTIVLYQRSADENEPPGDPTRAEAQGVGFCDRWRADPNVWPTVLATGVADMRLEQTGRPYEATERLRITLTWSSDSSDGPDEASVLVDAAMSNDAQPE